MSAGDRHRAAFAAVLARDPSTPPGPTALNRELWPEREHHSNKIGWSKLRAELLIQAGFTKDETTGRWHK